jgi:hypothetical protein
MQEYAVVIEYKIISFINENERLEFYNHFTGHECLLIPIDSSKSLSVGMNYNVETNLFE